MKNDDDAQHEQPAPARRKKPYEAPRLVPRGHVARLTRGAPTGPLPDGKSGMSMV